MLVGCGGLRRLFFVLMIVWMAFYFIGKGMAVSRLWFFVLRFTGFSMYVVCLSSCCCLCWWARLCSCVVVELDIVCFCTADLWGDVVRVCAVGLVYVFFWVGVVVVVCGVAFVELQFVVRRFWWLASVRSFLAFCRSSFCFGKSHSVVDAISFRIDLVQFPLNDSSMFLRYL